MKIALLGMGTRGDVQPLLALSQGLSGAGFEVKIIASSDFRDFVESAGIAYDTLGISMKDLMSGDLGKAWVEDSGKNPMLGMRRLKEMLASTAGTVSEELLRATADADVIVSGLPVFMYADAIAEKYNKRHITLQFVPYNPTKAGYATIETSFPGSNSFINKFAGNVAQYFTYTTYRDSSQIFRKRLGLPGVSYSQYRKQYNRNLPIIYGLSRHVLPKPSDWDKSKYVTGYWFYNAPSDWQASPELSRFLENGDKPIYIGFGSMSSSDPESTAKIIISALERTGQRGIIQSGWAGLNADHLPDNIFLLDSAPHDWLFPKMAGVIHHGGAGTTGTGIRAAVPATVVSHMADQPYWGRRVHQLGVATKPLHRQDLTANRLAEAITELTTNSQMRENARILGEKVRAEDGVAEAVKVFQQILR